MQHITELEITFLNWIRNNLSCNFLDVIMKLITQMGNSGIMFVVIAIFCLLYKNTRVFGCVFSVAMSLQFLIVSGILKPIIARPRPYMVSDIDLIISQLTSFSFPSGHTAVAFAFAFSLLIYGKKSFIPGLIFAILMGFSRMYLYVHFPSDVLVGAIIGALCGYASYYVAKKIVLNREKNKGMEG